MAAEEAVLRTMLFDFYGELLTEKQREYFDLHYNEDLSLAEIAALTGISRQGVWDIIRRAEATLRDIEAKTGLVARFGARRSRAWRRGFPACSPLLTPRQGALPARSWKNFGAWTTEREVSLWLLRAFRTN